MGYYLKQWEWLAAKMVVDYPFATIGLHRIEAGVMPHNAGSIRVLEKARFS